MTVVVLAGGTGGAKLARGMLDVVGDELVVIANTADDIEIYGAHVSPDPDLCTFWLADRIDERGWGLRDDTFAVMDGLRELGVEVWFNLGDRDLALCLRRARRLEQRAAALLAVAGDQPVQQVQGGGRPRQLGGVDVGVDPDRRLLVVRLLAEEVLDRLAHLVVAEVVEALGGVLAQQAAAPQGKPAPSADALSGADAALADAVLLGGAVACSSSIVLRLSAN